MTAGRNGRIGQTGEDQAAAWYEARGYQVLDRNWRSGRLGEIDLVAMHKGELVVSEVKARSSDRFGLPAEAVTHKKQTTLRQLGSQYLAEHRDLKVRRIRFDVVAILGGELDVITDAF